MLGIRPGHLLLQTIQNRVEVLCAGFRVYCFFFAFKLPWELPGTTAVEGFCCRFSCPSFSSFAFSEYPGVRTLQQQQEQDPNGPMYLSKGIRRRACSMKGIYVLLLLLAFGSAKAEEQLAEGASEGYDVETTTGKGTGSGSTQFSRKFRKQLKELDHGAGQTEANEDSALPEDANEAAEDFGAFSPGEDPQEAEMNVSLGPRERSASKWKVRGRQFKRGANKILGFLIAIAVFTKLLELVSTGVSHGMADTYMSLHENKEPEEDSEAPETKATRMIERQHLTEEKLSALQGGSPTET